MRYQVLICLIKGKIYVTILIIHEHPPPHHVLLAWSGDRAGSIQALNTQMLYDGIKENSWNRFLL